MPNFARRVFSYKFNASCKIHDLDYASNKFTRLQADTRFFTHMMRQSAGYIFWELIALCYLVITRLIGRMSWHRESVDGTV